MGSTNGWPYMTTMSFRLWRLKVFIKNRDTIQFFWVACHINFGRLIQWDNWHIDLNILRTHTHIESFGNRYDCLNNPLPCQRKFWQKEEEDNPKDANHDDKEVFPYHMMQILKGEVLLKNAALVYLCKQPPSISQAYMCCGKTTPLALDNCPHVDSQANG